jgi:hypothetical protein
MSGPTTSPGVVATNRDTLAIARMAARKGRAADLTHTVRERFGVDLPNGPVRVQSKGLAFIGIGVATWLATTDNELDVPRSYARDFQHLLTQSAAEFGYGRERHPWLP